MGEINGTEQSLETDQQERREHWQFPWQRITFLQLKTKQIGHSLAVQWLGLYAFTAEGPGSIPDRGTKIPQATQNKTNTNKQNPKTTVPYNFCFCFIYPFFFLIATLFIYLFIYFFSCVGSLFRARAFSSCGKRGPLFIAVRGPLTIAAPPVVGHRLQTCRLSSCGSRAQSLRGMWDLPRPGLEPVSPALAGRLSTTAPPGKPPFYFVFSFSCFQNGNI